MSCTFASLALFATIPLNAELLPPLEQITLPSDREVLNQLLFQLTQGGTLDWEEMLAAHDKALAKLREPTKLRGYVQFSRATALAALNRNAEALETVEESIRLLPDYSGPLILAAWTYGYAGRPQQGADYLLRASYKDPQAFVDLDDYEVSGLLRRLHDVRDERRIRVVSARLLEVGWLGRRVGSRSALALQAIKRNVAEGNIEGARALVPKLLVPSHSRALLIDHAYRQIWPDIETWAGPRLEKQWSMYLTEARERWAASKDPATVGDYAEALLAADDEETVLREILPLFSEKLDRLEDYDLMYVASGVASALARRGRWDDIEQLYARAQAVWPLGEHANALNITANHARWLLFRGSYREALAKMDAAIEDANRWGTEVNSGALVTMHLYRACMLRELGDDAAAGVSMATVAAGGGPDDVAFMHLCMNNAAAARDVLVTALKEERTRSAALGFVQPSNDPPIDSDFGRRLDARLAALKADPVLLREVGKYGRVLPYDISEGAPARSRSPGK